MNSSNDRYTTNSHCVYNISYHLIWCPKYRKKILVNGIDDRLKFLLSQKSRQIGISIAKMEVMPDHVHLFVKSTPALPVDYIINQLKGYTSAVLRREYPRLRKQLPNLWSRSYYCETIGHISEDTIIRYIEEQKSH